MPLPHPMILARPEPGELRQLRGGPVVRVVSAGLKYVRIVDEMTGTNERQARLLDLLPVPQAKLADTEAHPAKAAGARPSMQELDQEFLGDVDAR